MKYDQREEVVAMLKLGYEQEVELEGDFEKVIRTCQGRGLFVAGMILKSEGLVTKCTIRPVFQ